MRQLQADIYGKPVVPVNSEEGPASAPRCWRGRRRRLRRRGRGVPSHPQAPRTRVVRSQIHEAYAGPYQRFSRSIPALKVSSWTHSMIAVPESVSRLADPDRDADVLRLVHRARRFRQPAHRRPRDRERCRGSDPAHRPCLSGEGGRARKLGGLLAIHDWRAPDRTSRKPARHPAGTYPQARISRSGGRHRCESSLRMAIGAANTFWI